MIEPPQRACAGQNDLAAAPTKRTAVCGKTHAARDFIRVFCRVQSPTAIEPAKRVKVRRGAPGIVVDANEVASGAAARLLEGHIFPEIHLEEPPR